MKGMTMARPTPSRQEEPSLSTAEVSAVPEAARAALARVRLNVRVIASPAPGVRPRRQVVPGQYSGPGPDARDPQRLAGAWEETVSDQGWSGAARASRLYELWGQVVGPQNAEHAHIETFDPASGTLVVRASSTTWAESLRLMLPMLGQRISEVIGSGVVSDIQVNGPVAPSWTHGRLRVKGQGPRDTYG